MIPHREKFNLLGSWGPELGAYSFYADGIIIKPEEFDMAHTFAYGEFKFEDCLRESLTLRILSFRIYSAIAQL